MIGVWQTGSGTARFYDTVVLGTLRDQLCYPRVTGADDGKLRSVLVDVNLPDLSDRFGGLDVERQWADVLSPGEQQRLAFARLLLNRPAYAFLDEATSALDGEDENRLYERLREIGTHIVSAGHRPSLLRYHRNVLELLPDHWALYASDKFQKPLTTVG